MARGKRVVQDPMEFVRAVMRIVTDPKAKEKIEAHQKAVREAIEKAKGK